jgi:hypothetical protein
MAAAERIFDDLLDLEINVIVKPGMTARKMPETAHALLDIIGDYNVFLCRSAGRINTVLTRNEVVRIPVRLKGPYRLADTREATPPETAGSPQHTGTDDAGWGQMPLQILPVDDTVSVETFDRLREWAVQVEAAYRLALNNDWVEDDEAPILLKRIYRNCDQIKAILEKKGMTVAGVTTGIVRSTAAEAKLDFTPDELVTLRKVWDVGTETVLMQTVVQIDGDVVTRIQRGREGAAYKPIHDLHHEAVGNAIRHWQFLGQTVAQFLTSVLKSFFTR